MKRAIGLASLAVLASASIALAEPSGTFRQAYEYGFGALSVAYADVEKALSIRKVLFAQHHITRGRKR